VVGAGLNPPPTDGQTTGPGNDGGRVIAAPGAGTRDDQHDVGSERDTPDFAGDRARVIGLHVTNQGPGAGLRDPGGQQEGIAVGDIPWPERRSDRPDLIPGRDDRGHGLPGHLQRGMPRRSGGGQTCRAQPVACREQLAGREVLVGGAYVQPAAPGR
jgi:hypothetical protein